MQDNLIERLENCYTGAIYDVLRERGNINTITRFKFNFINIDFLNSWIGSLLYFIIMLLSILALNSQQKYLVKINSISTEPIIIEKNSIEDENINNNQKAN